MQRLPVSTQTLYADLVDRAWAGSYQELVQAGGSPYKQSAHGRDYWYVKMPMVNGERRPDRYLGPDGPNVRTRLEQHKALNLIRKERMSMVRALRSSRIPGPDPISGKIMSALSEAGAFRLRAVVVGSAAFQTYGAMLGVRLSAAAGQTSDLDIAQFHSISLAVEDSVPDSFIETLQEVDSRFRAIPSPIDGRRTLRYAIRTGSQEEFAVDLLSPHRGAERPKTTNLPALKGDAQLLRYLDFLIFGEINAVSLHGAGIPINVPAPERYAVHKLIVSRMRSSTPSSLTKARKDIVQAQALFEVLLEDRPDDVEFVWNEALERGPKWRKNLQAAAQSLSIDIREKLLALSGAASGPEGPGGS
ncbi:hypothetical protein KO516_13965 [Citreicella sp. C3M06]|uniref:nucleotidyltransferase family protein n=1 Tax=Citreicella sp. C3M06 TaxID=2841564 RepID=UPI001C0A4D18|nr:GSU2403 family nucleotidyltransferase fold protein [Citreicella sp. C3M06]MBU2961893.1 hypothetical protein [Citreicella sp. C3M06]